MFWYGLNILFFYVFVNWIFFYEKVKYIYLILKLDLFIKIYLKLKLFDNCFIICTVMFVDKSRKWKFLIWYEFLREREKWVYNFKNDLFWL